MNTSEFKRTVELLFGQLLIAFDEGEEFGYTDFGPVEIDRIGCATNLTPEIVKQAAAKKVQQIVTHHDAWDFIYGMKEECHALLKQHHINHFFAHLPLDYADFGTCASLFKALGIDKIIQGSFHDQGRSMPGIGEFTFPLAFEELVEKVRKVLQEDVKSWKHSERLNKRIGMITGAGNSTDNIRDALNADCDVYITGEKSLYTVQYAQYAGINLIVGSHTFTEIFGVRAIAEKLKEHFADLEVIQLTEPHFE